MIVVPAVFTTAAERSAWKAGYSRSMKPHYWEWAVERDRARYKTSAVREAFDAGRTAALMEKYYPAKRNPSATMSPPLGLSIDDARYGGRDSLHKVDFSDLVAKLRSGYGEGIARPMQARFPEFSKADHERAARVFYRAYVMQTRANRRKIDPRKTHISGLGVPRPMLERASRLLSLHSLHWIASHPRAQGFKSRGLFKGVYVGFDK